MWEEDLGTQAGVHLIEGGRLIWGPLNTGFTVYAMALIRTNTLFLTELVLKSTHWQVRGHCNNAKHE